MAPNFDTDNRLVDKLKLLQKNRQTIVIYIVIKLIFYVWTVRLLKFTIIKMDSDEILSA